MLDITFATLLLVAASGVLALYVQLKILQKSSYSLTGYFKRLTKSYTTEFALSAVLYCAITIAVSKDKEILALILAAILLLLRVAVNIIVGKNSTVKLAFTARVKRLYIAAIVILGALVVVSTVSTGITVVNVCRTICLLLAIIIPILTCLVWAITLPIEKCLSLKKKKEPSVDDGATD